MIVYWMLCADALTRAGPSNRKQNRNYMVLHIICFSWHACSLRCGLLFMLNSYYVCFAFFRCCCCCFIFIFIFCKCWLTPYTRLRRDRRLYSNGMFHWKRTQGKKPVSSQFLFSDSTKRRLFRRNAYFSCVNRNFVIFVNITSYAECIHTIHTVRVDGGLVAMGIIILYGLRFSREWTFRWILFDSVPMRMEPQ